MQKITPFLWFDDQAEEAASLYTSIFEGSKVGAITRYSAEAAKVSGRAAGSVMTVAFQLCGQQFTALNGGPAFQFTPAISFFVRCETEKQIDELWQKLSESGTVLMEFGPYPFSEKYGWLKDRFGVSWQLMLARTKQKIAPALLFVGEQFGKAAEAINGYISLFEDAGVTFMQRSDVAAAGPEKTVQFATFTLGGQEFMAMDGQGDHRFGFTPATSFVVNCDTQQEVDRLWEKLSADKAAEQCGWLKDKYGVSWQIVPKVLSKMLADSDPQRLKRVSQALFRMKRLDIAALQSAYEGR
jgi:predicted 3-demethylubiquinone-9 3-methyltransferase (glyoxalase superfamily)